ncbi:MAG: glycoside hydrolase family 25 protein [Lachnospiraceae bacterium]|nr:glycoside hydrolase family 25 protein [Lachnospiraceae bacterium]
MKLQGDYDYEERRGGVPVGAVSIAIVALMAMILVIVFMNQNDNNKRNVKPVETVEESRTTKEEERVSLDEYISGSTLTADDLDFWDMYPEREGIEETRKEDLNKDKDKNKETEEEESIEDPALDGKHTKITYADGSEEWVLISPYLTKNSYDFTNLVSQSNIMKYYENGKKISFLGVDVSKYQDYVDFETLKSAGVDYVMIRVGARGYSTGQITLDDNFDDNMVRAKEAGLDVGVYFYSQAISEAEAVEEANFVLEHIAGYEIDYPVAFLMEKISNDKARIDGVSKNDKTMAARAFLNTVKDAGYMPMVYGTKEWLIKEVELSKLTEYDIWLSQNGDLPDYPYRFSMWQYTSTAEISGIEGYANLNINFIDYSAK